jgi:hypothetical protein
MLLKLIALRIVCLCCPKQFILPLKHLIALEADHSPPSSFELKLKIHGAVPPPVYVFMAFSTEKSMHDCYLSCQQNDMLCSGELGILVVCSQFVVCSDDEKTSGKANTV